MTPQFYARYIPPKPLPKPIQDEDHPEASEPLRKRRRHDNAGTRKTSVPTSAIPGPDASLHATEVSTFATKTAAKASKSKLKKDHGHGSTSPAKKGLPESTSAKSTLIPDFEQKPVLPVHDNNGANPGTLGDGAKSKKKKKKQKRDRQADEHATSEPAVDSISATSGMTSAVSKHDKVLSKYERSRKAAPPTTDIESDQKDQPIHAGEPPQTHGLVPLPQPAQVPDAAPPSLSSALPVWIRQPITVSTSAAVPFDQFSLSQSVMGSMRTKGLSRAFAIQAAALPLLLQGEKQHDGDLCIAASTGCGKTLAYALPMIEALRNKPVTHLRGLVVVPTRELVAQARETLESCSAGTGLKIGTAFGSKPLKEEQESLIGCEQRYDPVAYEREHSKVVDEDEELLNWDDDQIDGHLLSEPAMVGYVKYYQSIVDILVCTPGRLIEHLQHTRGFSLDRVQWLVVDEADRLLDENLQQWVDTVMPALEYQEPPDELETMMMEKFHLLPKRQIRKIIISATMTRDVSKLQDLKLRRPKLVVLRNDPSGEDPVEEEGTPNLGAVSGEQIELPAQLQEIAVQIKDEQNKPLYLIDLLSELQSSNRRPSKSGSAKKQSPTNDSDDTSDSDSSSSASSSSSSSSSSPSSSSRSSSTSSTTSKTSSPLHPSQPQPHGSLIFTHSTSSAHRLSRLLSLLSPTLTSKSATLTKSSKSSKKILTQFQNRTLSVIISTDRASRGLDIQDLASVINYDMPPSVDSYIHRVGRTARAGKGGMAFTLVGWSEGRWFWREVGRGDRIRRSGGRKIVRRGGKGGKGEKEGEWSEERLEAYAEALKKLEKEAKGG